MPTREELGWAPISLNYMSTEFVPSIVAEEKMRRTVSFEPGHPRTNHKGSDYGIGTLSIRFTLHGALGSLDFLWSTGLVPERTTRTEDPATWDPKVKHLTALLVGMEPFAVEEWTHHAPTGARIGIHTDAVRVEGQQSEPCEHRPSGACFYDATYTQSDPLLEIFLTRGEEAMWLEMEKHYVTWLVAAE